MTSSKINQQNYNIWSKTYDDYTNPTVEIDERNLPSYYSDWFEYNVLEVGCGTGRHTIRLVGQKNNVTGIDISEGMLSKAKEKLPSVHFIHGDFLEEPFQASHFDRVLMSLVLEHIKDINSFFLKVKEILRPGGEILISELHSSRGEQGVLAHFKMNDGEEVRLSSVCHKENDIIKSAEYSGLKLKSKSEIVADQNFCQLNPKWEKYLEMPMISIMSFRS